MNLHVVLETGWSALLPLTAQIALAVALTALLLWKLRDAAWKRALWQTCFLCLAGLLAFSVFDLKERFFASGWGGARSVTENSASEIASFPTAPVAETERRPPARREPLDGDQLAGSETGAPMLPEAPALDSAFRIPHSAFDQSFLTPAPAVQAVAKDVSTSPTLLWWFWLGWAGGAVALLARLMIARLALAGFCWRYRLNFDNELGERVQSIATRLDMKRRIRVFGRDVLPRVRNHAAGKTDDDCPENEGRAAARPYQGTGSSLRTPIAFGLFLPSIALPGDFTQRFSRAEQDAMLAHELAHLAARDPLWYLLADVLCALLWWHPLVWWARSQLHTASELSADEASQLVEDGPQSLADCLVRLAGELTRPAALESIGVEGDGFRSRLGRRVERLLRLANNPAAATAPRPSGWVKVLGPVVLLALLLTGTGWIAPNALRQPGDWQSRFHSAWDGLYAALEERQEASLANAALGGIDQTSTPPREEPLQGQDDIRKRARERMEGSDTKVETQRELRLLLQQRLVEAEAQLTKSNYTVAVKLFEECVKLSEKVAGAHEEPERNRALQGLNRARLADEKQRAANRLDGAAEPVPNRQELEQQRQSLQEAIEAANKIYQPAHPKMQNLQHQLAQVEGQLRAQAPLPSAVQQNYGPAKSFATSTRGQQAILKKLREIRFGDLQLERMPLGELVRTLTEKSRELDPERVGVRITIEPSQLDPTKVISEKRIGSDTSLGRVLMDICRDTNQPMKFSVQDDSVVLIKGPPLEPMGEFKDLPRETFRVDPEVVLKRLSEREGIPLEADSDHARYALSRYLMDADVRWNAIFIGTKLNIIGFKTSAPELERARRAVGELNGKPVPAPQLQPNRAKEAALPEDAKDAQSGELQTLEQQRQSLQEAIEAADKIYQPAHPQMVKLQQQLAKVEEQLRGLAPLPSAVQDTQSGAVLSSDVEASQQAASRLVKDGQLLYEQGQHKEAEAKLLEAIKLNPLNQPAYYYLSLIHEARRPDEIKLRSAFEAVRNQAAKELQEKLVAFPSDHPEVIKWQGAVNHLDKVLAQVEDRMKGQATPSIPREHGPRNPPVSATKSRQAILRKLDSIRLPEVHFDGLPLSEVMKFLHEESKRLDPEKKGVAILVNPNLEWHPYERDGKPVLDPTGQPYRITLRKDMDKVIVRLSAPLADLTLAQALDVVVKFADQPIMFIVEDYAVVFTSGLPTGPRLFTRTYKVDPSVFMQGLQSVIQRPSGVPGVAVTPQQGGQTTATGSAAQGASTVSRVSRGNPSEVSNLVREYFVAAGVDLSTNTPVQPSMVFYDEHTGGLMVRAVPEILEKVQAKLNALPKPPLLPTTDKIVFSGAARGAITVKPGEKHFLVKTLLASGWTDFADVLWVKVQRVDPKTGGTNVTEVNVNAILNSLRGSQVRPDFQLQAGDLVQVMERWPTSSTGGAASAVPQPAVATTPQLYTRTFKVDPQVFVQGLAGVIARPLGVATPAQQGTQTGNTPNAVAQAAPTPTSVRTNNTAAISEAVRQYFIAAGINLSANQSGQSPMVYYKDHEGILMVRATAEDMEKVTLKVAELTKPPLQISVEVRTAHIPETNILKQVMDFPWTKGAYGLLTDPQRHVLLRALEQRSGVKVESWPKVTTLSGRQAHLSGSNATALDVLAHLNPDQSTMRVTAIISRGTITTTSDNYVVVQHSNVWSGATILLLETNKTGNAQGGTLHFITLDVLDPAGQPLNKPQQIEPGTPIPPSLPPPAKAGSKPEASSPKPAQELIETKPASLPRSVEIEITGIRLPDADPQATVRALVKEIQIPGLNAADADKPLIPLPAKSAAKLVELANRSKARIVTGSVRTLHAIPAVSRFDDSSLKITPLVNVDGLVVLDIEQEIEMRRQASDVGIDAVGHVSQRIALKSGDTFLFIPAESSTGQPSTRRSVIIRPVLSDSNNAQRGESETKERSSASPSPASGKASSAAEQVPTKPARIMIEAKLAEISDSVVRELGLLWFTANPAMASVADPKAASTTISNPAPDTNRVVSVDAIANMSTTLTDAQFRALIKTLEQKDGVDVLSAPQVTTLSGRQAQVSVKDLQTMVVGKTNGLPQVKELWTGPAIDLIPTVNADGSAIELLSRFEFNEFLGYDKAKDRKAEPLPRTRERVVWGRTLIPNGQTLMIGSGSVTDTKVVRTKVPVLGDIPGVGRLFRGKKEVTPEPRHVLIFLTPVLVDEDGKPVKP